MKKLRCVSCGFERKIITQAKVKWQKGDYQLSYKWLCIPCLLAQLGLVKHTSDDNYDNKMAMECLDN